MLTNEGPAAVDEAIDFCRTAPSVAPFAQARLAWVHRVGRAVQRPTPRSGVSFDGEDSCDSGWDGMRWTFWEQVPEGMCHAAASHLMDVGPRGETGVPATRSDRAITVFHAAAASDYRLPIAMRLITRMRTQKPWAHPAKASKWYELL